MEIVKTPDWHLLIVWYFFIGGIAGGAYFTAAIADNFGSDRDRGVFRIGYTLALLLIGLCGILLILDLGTPSRFMNMMGAFKFWDPMSIGAWMLGVFGLFAFLSAALAWVGGEARAPLRRKLSLLGTIFGFFLASYTGVLLSATRAALLERGAADGGAVPRLRRVHRHGRDLPAPLPLRRVRRGRVPEGQARRPIRDGPRAGAPRRLPGAAGLGGRPHHLGHVRAAVLGRTGRRRSRAPACCWIWWEDASRSWAAWPRSSSSSAASSSATSS